MIARIKHSYHRLWLYAGWLRERVKRNGVVGALPMKPGAGSFCALPFTHLQINAVGNARVCCMIREPLLIEGQEASVYRHTLEQIWNAPQMREIRQRMIAGQPVSACRACQEEEGAGAVSRRMRENRNIEAGAFSDGLVTLRGLKAKATDHAFRMPTPPMTYHLDVGSQCNLKCRMCFSFASTRIARDAVHNAWTDFGHKAPDDTRFANGKPWHQQRDFIYQELLRDPGSVKMLSFYGGEPFIIKEIGDFLQRLVDAGAARDVELMISTNGTTSNAQWLHLLPHFKRLMLSFSIDGFGPYYEYIRYPARWATLTRNLETLRKMPRTTSSVNVTFQAYNALNVVELFRYLDSIDVPFSVNPLHLPELLAPTILPPAARRLAAGRLRRYALTECLARSRAEVLGLATMIDAPTGTGLDGCDLERLRTFMIFTNDLDQSRGQRFADTHAELVALFAEAGLPWSDETRHAHLAPHVHRHLPVLPALDESSAA